MGVLYNLYKMSIHNFKDFVELLLQKFPQRVGLCEPEFLGNEMKYLENCIQTGWVSTAGKYVTDFEEQIKNLTGAKFAVATNTGTSALHTLYLASGIANGDEVLTQSLTFVATVSAIAHSQAIPHFVDVRSDHTLTIDVDKLKNYLQKIATIQQGQCFNQHTGRRIRALVVMHTFGKSARLQELKDLCDEFNIKLIEDAAEALGTKYKNQHVGHYGAGGVFSFNGNKIITSGGGGMVVTNHEEIAQKARHLSTTAKTPHPYLYDHDDIGYNYRMPNINAAVGLAQLEKLSEFLNAKKNIWQKYKEMLAGLDHVELLGDEPWTESNHWLITARLKNCSKETLLTILKDLNQHNVGVRPVWTPIHQLKPYLECPRDDLSMTEKLSKEIINLPSSSKLIHHL